MPKIETSLDLSPLKSGSLIIDTYIIYICPINGHLRSINAFVTQITVHRHVGRGDFRPLFRLSDLATCLVHNDDTY